MDSLHLIKSNEFGSFHMNLDACHLFWYMTYERQNIWYKRFVLRETGPWTEDEILSSFKFTNVYRENDRTTLWYHENIGGYGKFPNGFTEKDVIFATFAHRLFNRIETMGLLLPYLTLKEFNLDRVRGILEQHRNQGNGVFTTAHMTTGIKFQGSPDKLYNITYLIDLIHKDIDDIYVNIKRSKSLEELYLEVRKVNGFGPFLGYQYILDMINTKIAPFSHDDFVVAGPGCKRGIRHIFPNAEEISFENAMIYFRKNQHKYFAKYGFDFKQIEQYGGGLCDQFIGKDRPNGIHLGNIENQFCEFSKYYKAYHGTGRPRNKFIPTVESIYAD